MKKEVSMPYEKNVVSANTIAKAVADMREGAGLEPIENRTKVIGQVEDFLHSPKFDRQVFITRFLDGDVYKASGYKAVIGRVDAFRSNIMLTAQPYERKPMQAQISYRHSLGTDNVDRKIVNQGIYDMAVEQGFPQDFFLRTRFVDVKFYCLPDNANFTNSILHNCEFVACRAVGAMFDFAALYNVDFGSVDLTNSNFCLTSYSTGSLVRCTFSGANLSYARFNGVTIIRCGFDNVLCEGTHLRRCHIHKLIRPSVHGMQLVNISGDGTAEEAERHRQRQSKELGLQV